MKNPFIITITFVCLLAFEIVGKNPDNIHSKIDVLNQTSKTFCKTNFDSAGFYAHKALGLSEQIDCPTGKINAIDNLAEANLYLGSLDSSLALSHQVLEIATAKKNLKEYRFPALYRICKIYHYKGEFSMALQAANKAIDEIDKDMGGKHFAMIHNLKGLTYKQTGKFDLAQEQFIEALAYADDDDNEYLRSVILTNLGIVNRNLMQYREALEYYDRALLSLEIMQDTFGMGLLYQNIAAVYADENKNRKSLGYNFLAKTIISKNNMLSIDYATLLNNIGLNYYGMHQHDSAIWYLNGALKISVGLDDAFGVADTKINIGRVYLKENKPDTAHKIIEEGIAMATGIEANDVAIEGYEALIACEVFAENYKAAFATQTLLTALHDSVYNIEKVKAINELQKKYETEKKEQQISLLETENELKQIEIKQKARQRNWLTGFFVVLLIVAGIIYYYYKKTKAAKNKIETLQREIHHRVKNNLAIIRRLLDVSRQNIDDEAARTALTGLANRIVSMAQVHQQLYKKTDITQINFNAYINDLAKNIHSSFSANHIKLFQNIGPGIDLGFNKVVPVGLIFNELLTNAFKYAVNNDGVKIIVTAKARAGRLFLKVSDNGQGLPDDFDIYKNNSYGLKLVSGLAQQLNGTVKFYNDGGAVAELSVPA